MAGENERLCGLALKVLSRHSGPGEVQHRKEILGRFFGMADKKVTEIALDLLSRFPAPQDRSMRSEILRRCLNAARDERGRVYSEHDYVYSDEPLSGSDRWLTENGVTYFAGCVYKWEEDDGPGLIHPQYSGYLIDLIRNPPSSEFLFLADTGTFNRIWCDNVYRQNREVETLVPKTS
ncbi:Uncharacterised protein [uncultured archaeon]|nr:Uncharacterised protein [uncultured archaeon]